MVAEPTKPLPRRIKKRASAAGIIISLEDYMKLLREERETKAAAVQAKGDPLVQEHAHLLSRGCLMSVPLKRHSKNCEKEQRKNLGCLLTEGPLHKIHEGLIAPRTGRSPKPSRSKKDALVAMYMYNL